MNKPGTYIVHTYDAPNCEHWDTVNITFRGPKAIPATYSVCEYQPFDLPAGVHAEHYAWYEMRYPARGAFAFDSVLHFDSVEPYGGDTGNNYERTYKLVIYDKNGCTDTAVMTIKILLFGGGRVKFKYYPDTTSVTCQGQKFIFTTENNVVGYDWHFSDGGTASGQTVKHAFSHNGAYWVKLTLTGANGCSKTDSGAIVVNYAPPAEVQTNQATQCLAGNSFTFSDKYFAAGTGRKYSWDLGDGTTSADSMLMHSYADTGTYHIRMNLTTAEGCTNRSEMNVIVQQLKPEILVKDSISCLEETFYFSDKHEYPAAHNSYTWDFGDGNTDNKARTQHRYTASGNYTVKLTVSNGSQCSGTATQNLNVDLSPLISINGPDTVIAGTVEVYFATGKANSWEWNTLDANIIAAVGKLAVIQFGKVGTAKIILTVTDNSGCIVRITKEVQVIDGSGIMPQPAFRLLQLYPNPATSALHIKLPLAAPQVLQVQVYNMLGQQVKETSWNAGIGMQEYNLPLDGLPAGHYLLRLLGDKNISTQEFLKQ